MVNRPTHIRVRPGYRLTESNFGDVQAYRPDLYQALLENRISIVVNDMTKIVINKIHRDSLMWLCENATGFFYIEDCIEDGLSTIDIWLAQPNDAFNFKIHMDGKETP